MSPEQQLARAANARSLLENPLLAEIFQTMKNEVIEKWQNSSAQDDKGREKLWLTHKLIQQVEGTLYLTVEQGKVAQQTLLQRAKTAARDLAQRTGVTRSR